MNKSIDMTNLKKDQFEVRTKQKKKTLENKFTNRLNI